ncbi:hypothetical protein [Luteipulveratus halotolerans]|uniref:Alkylmercury lyase n=1 Tax=Luteipulveratus halotolerans TaxID=1631356 RepID=A0A0L6CDI9_9MICO|nr:hypothetical protein [Luteipulveratus halotolerans]KNX35882.1 hypothetical protein VV01_21675 [Luteipulveratus halotolerans]
MKCVLAVVPGCPHVGLAEKRFRSALEHAVAAAVDVEVIVIGDDAAAAERGFVGSPTFFIDGRDLFPAPGAVSAVACRMYRLADGRAAGVPDELELLDAVRAATTR